MTVPSSNRVQAIDFAGFHIRISEVFGDRTGGDHVAVRPGWYYLWLLIVTVQSIDFIIKIVKWLT